MCPQGRPLQTCWPATCTSCRPTPCEEQLPRRTAWPPPINRYVFGEAGYSGRMHQASVTCHCGALQGFQTLLEEAVLANSGIDIPAMEDAYVALVDAPPAVSRASAGACPADSLAIAAHDAGGALPVSPASLVDFRALICRLTAQQRSIAAMKKQARNHSAGLQLCTDMHAHSFTGN